ncbi:MAG: S-layer homology domain-containing protein, partial [Clostridia bacterium]|nr:S-layer homology domain-containing protein [Clostridia bacterium]
MTRKFLLFVSVILLLLLLPSAALAQDFSDLPEGPYGAVLQKAADNGLLTGANGKIMPGGELTRAQMAAVISRAFGAAEKADISSFVDVKQAAWYYQYLQTAVKMGVLKGDGNKLNPLSAISREEAFTVIARALKLDEAQTAKRQFADLSEASAWAKGSVYALINNGYVNGDGKNLHLKSSITRAEFATIFDNIIKTYASKAGTYTAAGAGNFMINCDKVTLKDLTVNGDLIIGDGVAAGDVTLDNVTVTGRVVVRGGGQNSLHIINKSKIGTLILSKTASGAVRVVTENGAQIEFVYINDGKDDVILEGSFDNVELNSNIPLIAQNAQVNELQLNAPSASVSLTAGSSIQNFNISEQAAGSSLSVGAGTSVSNVNSTAANVQIAGSGTVTNAQISGNNTKVDTKGTALTVSQGTTGVTNNGQSVSSGTTVTVPPVTGGGGGGGSSSYIAKVSSEAELLAALNNSNASSVQINNNIELTADLTISKPVDVLTGKTLTVAAGKTLTLKADLKIIGTLENNGSIIVAGKTALAANGGIFVTGGILTNNIGAAITLKKAEAEQAGFRVASGMMIAEDNGKISNYGTITSEADVNSPEWRPGGFFSVERGSSFDNFGTLNINGLDFILGSDDLAGTLTNKAGGTVNLAAKININGKGVLVNEGTLSLNTNGDIIVHNILRADSAQDSKGTLTETVPIFVNGGRITRNANTYSEARLREALSLSAAYDNISCLSTVTLTDNLTVPAGKALLIEDDNTDDQNFVFFTVPAGFTLT